MTSLASLIVISSKLMNIPLAAAWTVVLGFSSCSSSWRYDRGVDIDARLRHAQLLESFRSDNHESPGAFFSSLFPAHMMCNFRL